MENKKRIQLARWALDTFRLNHPDYHGHPEEPDLQAINDLIANLLHLAKDLGDEDPEQRATTAIGHFQAETEVSKRIQDIGKSVMRKKA